MGRMIRTIGRYVLLTAVALLLVGPFLWMVSTSMKDQEAIFRTPPSWFPETLNLGNYRTIMEVLPLGKMFLNSFTIAVGATIGQLTSCILAAYAFARMRFRGSSTLYFALLATMMVPAQVTMIPVFFIMKSLGLIDTLYALILPAFFGGAILRGLNGSGRSNALYANGSYGFICGSGSSLPFTPLPCSAIHARRSPWLSPPHATSAAHSAIAKAVR